MKLSNNLYLTTGLRNGLMAGGVMGIYLFGLKWMGVELTSSLKFLKYIFLFIFLYLMLHKARMIFQPLSFFRKGIRLGLTTSVVAGLALMFILFFSYLIGGTELAISKFGQDASSFGELLLIGGVLFFEVLVYGMIGTFISLQYLKYGGEVPATESK